MGGRAAEGRFPLARVFASGLGNRPWAPAGCMLLGLAAFLLFPGYIGIAVVVLSFGWLACVTPYWSLLALIGALPLHFAVRRSLGPVDVSLPEAILLATILGLLAGVYWRGLTVGSRALLSPLRGAFQSPYFWPGLLLIGMGTVSVAAPELTPRKPVEYLTVGLRRYTLLIEPLAVYALVLTTLRDRRRLWLALDVLLAASLTLAFSGLLDAAWSALSAGKYQRTNGLFTHPNTLALFLTRALPFFGTLAILLPGPAPRKRIYGAGAVLMAIVMLLTGSRGGWLAAGAGALLIVLVLGRYRWLLPALAAAAAGFALLFLTAGRRRFTTLFTPGRNSADTRRRLWKGAVEEIQDSPIWGTGLGDLSWMKRHVPKRRLVANDLIDAHNLFLDFWTKLGAAGVIAITWILLRFYITTLRAVRGGDATTRALAAAPLAAMTAGIAHGLVDWFYFGLPLAVWFWFMLGLVEVVATDRS